MISGGDRPRFRCLVLGTILLACSRGLAETAILVALPAEESALHLQVRMVGQSIDLAHHRITVGYRKGEKLYIVRTGAGNLNAAMITQALLTRYRIDWVISIGVAGDLNDAWKVGDLLIATNVVDHQEGRETPEGFQPKAQGEDSEARRQKSEAYDAKCAELQSNAVTAAHSLIEDVHANAAAEIPRPARNDRPVVRQGRLVSGDAFIASSQKRKWLRDTFQADAVDMVSAGIARVCEANGVPYVIVRLLSDNANETAPGDFPAFVNALSDPPTAGIAVRVVDHFAGESH